MPVCIRLLEQTEWGRSLKGWDHIAAVEMVSQTLKYTHIFSEHSLSLCKIIDVLFSSCEFLFVSNLYYDDILRTTLNCEDILK